MIFSTNLGRLTSCTYGGYFMSISAKYPMYEFFSNFRSGIYVHFRVPPAVTKNISRKKDWVSSIAVCIDCSDLVALHSTVNSGISLTALVFSKRICLETVFFGFQTFFAHNYRLSLHLYPHQHFFWIVEKHSLKSSEFFLLQMIFRDRKCQNFHRYPIALILKLFLRSCRLDFFFQDLCEEFSTSRLALYIKCQVLTFPMES